MIYIYSVIKPTFVMRSFAISRMVLHYYLSKPTQLIAYSIEKLLKLPTDINSQIAERAI